MRNKRDMKESSDDSPDDLLRTRNHDEECIEDSDSDEILPFARRTLPLTSDPPSHRSTRRAAKTAGERLRVHAERNQEPQASLAHADVHRSQEHELQHEDASEGDTDVITPPLRPTESEAKTRTTAKNRTKADKKRRRQVRDDTGNRSASAHVGHTTAVFNPSKDD